MFSRQNGVFVCCFLYFNGPIDPHPNVNKIDALETLDEPLPDNRDICVAALSKDMKTIVGRDLCIRLFIEFIENQIGQSWEN